MVCFENARLVLEDGILENGALLVCRGRIAARGRRGSFPVPEDAERIDAGGRYLAPGFVDLHVHGGGGHAFFREPEAAAAHYLAHGETSLLAAFYYDMTREEMLAGFDRIRAAMGSRGAGRAIRGVYMEGPYMNPKFGASPEKNLWRGPIRPEDYEMLADRAGTLARIWAVAPEREGLEPFLRYVKQTNPDAVFAVGHSEASPEQIEALRGWGISLQTHCMDATGRVPRWRGTRGCGPDEWCLTTEEAFAELISDSLGVHVDPTLQKLIRKAKGPDRVILITDGFVSDRPSPERLRQATDLCFDENGDLSGSRLTMDAAVRNYMRSTGATAWEAFLAASANPARAAGIYGELGSLTPGKRADLVLVNEEITVAGVWLGGDRVL